MLQTSSLLCSEGKTDEAETLASQAIDLAKEERMENMRRQAVSSILQMRFFSRGEFAALAEPFFRHAWTSHVAMKAVGMKRVATFSRQLFLQRIRRIR
jgi:hypothetical protein